MVTTQHALTVQAALTVQVVLTVQVLVNVEVVVNVPEILSVGGFLTETSIVASGFDFSIQLIQDFSNHFTKRFLLDSFAIDLKYHRYNYPINSTS